VVAPSADATRTLKILLASDCYVPRLGGIEVQVHELGRHLTAAGHQVEVVTPFPGPTDVDGIRVHRLGEPLLPLDVPFTPRTFRKTRAILAAGGYDVAHFHGGVVSPFAFGGAYLSQRQGIPTVMTSHCVWNRTQLVFKVLDRAVDWKAWPVVFSGVSDLAASEIRGVMGKGRPVLVLPNGITSSEWRVDPVEHDPGTVTLVSVMRFAPRKRPLPLLRMLAHIRQRAPRGVDVRLVLVGEGGEEQAVRATIERQGLKGAVDLPGRLGHEEIRSLYARADVYVAPANLESFGLAALEARCAGLPVVAKAQTGIREFVEHGQEGLLAANDHQFVDQVLALVRDTELRAKIANFNRATPARCEWPEVVQLTLDAYSQAAELIQPR
jgi:glycosyltransferase involved in cell wall biosynthesis